MKQFSTNFLFCLVLLFGFLSCKKDTKIPTPPPAPRKVRYILYVKNPFPDDDKLITFDAIMKNEGKVLFDTTLAPMKISAMPEKEHAIVFEKSVPAGNENADLVVGFTYYIQDVGYSWSLDTAKAGNPLKIMEYPFQ